VFKEAKLLGFFTFNICVCLFALILLLTAVFPTKAAAQSNAISQLDRRVTSIEALNLDHRLTVIETMLEEVHSDRWTHTGSMVGVGLLLIKEAVEAIVKRIKIEDE
jgi:hypothetical protein